MVTVDEQGSGNRVSLNLQSVYCPVEVLIRILTKHFLSVSEVPTHSIKTNF